MAPFTSLIDADDVIAPMQHLLSLPSWCEMLIRTAWHATQKPPTVWRNRVLVRQCSRCCVGRVTANIGC